MLAQMLSGLTLTDQDGERGRVEMTDLNPLHSHHTKNGEAYVRATFRVRFRTAPSAQYSIRVRPASAVAGPSDPRECGSSASLPQLNARTTAYRATAMKVVNIYARGSWFVSLAVRTTRARMTSNSGLSTYSGDTESDAGV